MIGKCSQRQRRKSRCHRPVKQPSAFFGRYSRAAPATASKSPALEGPSAHCAESSIRRTEPGGCTTDFPAPSPLRLRSVRLHVAPAVPLPSESSDHTPTMEGLAADDSQPESATTPASAIQRFSAWWTDRAAREHSRRQSPRFREARSPPGCGNGRCADSSTRIVRKQQ